MAFRLIEEIPNVNYLCTITFHRFLNRNLFRRFGRRINSFLIFEKGKAGLFLHENDLKQIGLILYNDLKNNPQRFSDYHRKVLQSVKDYFRFCSDLSKIKNLDKLSRKRLAALFQNFYSAHTKNHQVGLIDVILDLYNEGFSKRIREICHNKKDLNSSETEVILTSPLQSSKLEKEEIFFLTALLEVVRDNLLDDWEEHPRIVNKLKDYYLKHSWQSYMFIGPKTGFKAWKRKLNSFLDDSRKAVQEFELSLKKIELNKKKKELVKKLNLTEDEFKTIKVAEEVLYLKVLRKEAMVYGWHQAEKLLREIAARLKVSFRLLGFLTAEEIVCLLRAGKKADPILLLERCRKSLVKFIEGKEEVILSDEATVFILNNVLRENFSASNEKIIGGSTAYPGIAKGKVKIVNSPEEMDKLKKDDILVSIATSPDLVLAMEKAAAFVTDMGGLTCHAAIVAREMRKPCVVGTKIATKVLKDGDEVEVDANHGVVKKIK